MRSTFHIPQGIFHSYAISLADRRISLKNPKRKSFRVFHGAEDETGAYCFAIRPLRSTAARAFPTNMPQACLFTVTPQGVQVSSIKNYMLPRQHVVFWCGGRDLNSYGVTHRLLRPARLPISPPPHDILGLLALLRSITIIHYLLYNCQVTTHKFCREM